MRNFVTCTDHPAVITVSIYRRVDTLLSLFLWVSQKPKTKALCDHLSIYSSVLVRPSIQLQNRQIYLKYDIRNFHQTLLGNFDSQSHWFITKPTLHNVRNKLLLVYRKLLIRFLWNLTHRLQKLTLHKVINELHYGDYKPLIKFLLNSTWQVCVSWPFWFLAIFTYCKTYARPSIRMYMHIETYTLIINKFSNFDGI
jgi:hypothetical protein